MPKAAPSLTLALLQGREAVMAYFRPLLNKHNLTGLTNTIKNL